MKLIAIICKHRCTLGVSLFPFCMHTGFIILGFYLLSCNMITWYWMTPFRDLRATAYPGRLTLAGKHGPQKMYFPAYIGSISILFSIYFSYAFEEFLVLLFWLFFFFIENYLFLCKYCVSLQKVSSKKYLLPDL